MVAENRSTLRLQEKAAGAVQADTDYEGGGMPGSASGAGAADNARPTGTIEHVTKLAKDEVAALTRSLAEEWRRLASEPAH